VGEDHGSHIRGIGWNRMAGTSTLTVGTHFGTSITCSLWSAFSTGQTLQRVVKAGGRTGRRSVRCGEQHHHAEFMVPHLSDQKGKVPPSRKGW